MPRKSPDSALLETVRRAFSRLADPKRAPAMQAYMKSTMPFHGVPMPVVRQTCKELFADVDVGTPAVWEREVRALWHGARFREERYAAIVLTGTKAARAHQTPARSTSTTG